MGCKKCPSKLVIAMILLLIACLTPKYIGTIDMIDNGLCMVEFDDHFHFYDVSVCNGKVEGDKIKVH